MSAPLLSVTTTSYNYAQYIGKTIESVLNQSFTNFEYIIIDDASTDNSVEIINSYAARDDRIRFIAHQDNRGGTPTLVEACKMARGQYMVHMDSDDWILNQQAFELQIAMLENEPDMAFVFSPIVFFHKEDSEQYLSRAYESDTVQPGAQAIDKVLSYYVAHSGTVVRASSYRTCNGYNPSLRYALDLQLWTDLCGLGKVGYIDRPLYAYRQHPSSMSAMRRLRRSHEMMMFQRELLCVVESVFQGPLARTMTSPCAMHRHAIAAALTAGAAQCIFEGAYWDGWQAYAVGLRLRPIETLLQRRTLVLLSRTILGARGCQILKEILGGRRPAIRSLRSAL